MKKQEAYLGQLALDEVARVQELQGCSQPRFGFVRRGILLDLNESTPTVHSRPSTVNDQPSSVNRYSQQRMTMLPVMGSLYRAP